MIRALIALLLLGDQALAWAQEPPKEPPASPQASTPVVDPAHALSGRALVEALRGGGYVLLMRHAQQVRYTPECKPEEPNLGPAGQAQARLVAAGLRNLRIPVGSVQASMFCRAIETAQLLEAGPVTATPDLNPATLNDKELHAARRKLLADPPKAGTNTILVSHFHNSASDEERVRYELAEAIVYRPDGRGSAVAVARIRPGDWASLPR